MTGVIYSESSLEKKYLDKLTDITRETYDKVKRLAREVVDEMEIFENQHENIKMANAIALTVRMINTISKKMIDALVVEMAFNYVSLLGSVLDLTGVIVFEGGGLSDVEKNN